MTKKISSRSNLKVTAQSQYWHNTLQIPTRILFTFLVSSCVSRSTVVCESTFNSVTSCHLMSQSSIRGLLKVSPSPHQFPIYYYIIYSYLMINCCKLYHTL